MGLQEEFQKYGNTASYSEHHLVEVREISGEF